MILSDIILCSRSCGYHSNVRTDVNIGQKIQKRLRPRRVHIDICTRLNVRGQTFPILSQGSLSKVSYLSEFIKH